MRRSLFCALINDFCVCEREVNINYIGKYKTGEQQTQWRMGLKIMSVLVSPSPPPLFGGFYFYSAFQLKALTS